MYLHLCLPTECNPEWTFERIDGQESTISSGFNFRTVTYDTSEGSRYLTKLYGIRFVFVTDGTAGKFNFAALTVTFGGMQRVRIYLTMIMNEFESVNTLYRFYVVSVL